MANTSGSILLRVVLQASGMSSSMSTPREGKIHQTVDERSYHLAELLPALFLAAGRFLRTHRIDLRI